MEGFLKLILKHVIPLKSVFSEGKVSSVIRKSNHSIIG